MPRVRYRGLRKNLTQMYTLFALANVFRVRRQLMIRRRGASMNYQNASIRSAWMPIFRLPDAKTNESNFDSEFCTLIRAVPTRNSELP